MREIYERFRQNKEDIETLAYLALLLLDMEMEVIENVEEFLD